MNLTHFFQVICPLFLLCCFTITLSAQPESCNDFEIFETNQKFGKSVGNENGDTIRLLKEFATTTLQRFNYSNSNQTGFEDITVVDWDFGQWQGRGNYLFISNINLVVDFTQAPDAVSLVQFDFIDGGGEENIGVNGQTVQILEYLQDAPKAIAPGVELKVVLDSFTNIPSGTIYLYGNIEQLVLGGQELGIDNFCYVINDVPPMCIQNVIATPLPCTPNDIFYADLTFDYYNPASDSFFIKGNGQNYGQFAYGQSSYKVGPMDGNDSTRFEFVIVDAADPNCTNSTEIGPVSCNESTCDIQDLWVQSTGCQTDETQGIYFGFYQENIDTNGFIVLIDREFSTFFPFNLVADSIGYFLANLSLSSGEHTLTICTESDINCCETITFIVPNCNTNNDCRVFDIATEISDCQPDGTVNVWLNFNHESLNGDFFTVLLNGQSYDTFSLAELPVNLGNLDLYPDSNILSICVYQSTTVDTDDHFECCTDVFLDAPGCDTSDCQINNLFARVSDCQPDNLVDVFINFDHRNINPAGFDAFIDGQFYDFLPSTAGHGYTFPNLVLTAGEHSLTICGNDQPNCCQRVEFIVPECYGNEDCRVFNIKTEASACKTNGLHDVFVDFEYESLTGDYFELSLNGLFIDTFEFDQLPLIIEDANLPVDKSYVEICVYQSTTPLTTDIISCCTKQEFRVPDCTPFYCELSNLRKEHIECNADGLYDIEFAFDYDSIDLDLEAIKMLVDEEVYDLELTTTGQFQLKNVNIAPGNHRLTLCYKDAFLDCCISIDFYALDCENIGDCKIYNVGAEARSCDSLGYALVDVIFNVENPKAARFEIIGNGQNYGIFEYGQPFYTVGPVKGDGETAYEFIIKDLENPDCKGFTAISPFSCNPENNCQLADLRTEISDCATDGTVDIEVHFATELDNDSGFNVYIDEKYIETYGYRQVPFVLSKIDLPAGNHKLYICRNDVTNCCISKEIFIPACGTCAITNVTAVATDCENEDFFFVDVQFDVENPSSDKFRIVGNSQLYGVFEYGKDNYRLGPLDGDGATMYEFIVQDLRNESCASFAGLEQVINCEQGFVWPGDANFDNITDNFDLLNIGLAFGKTGPERIFSNPDSTDIAAGAEIAWEAKEAEDWDFRFNTGLNAKHADCNGDGIINEEDIRAIEENYFFTHGEAQTKVLSDGTPNDPALFVDFPALSDIEVGKETKVPIIFGNEAIPATAYGLAFTLKFDPRLIKDGRIEFIESWLGTPNQDLLTINKNISSDGFIEVALTRTGGDTPFGAGTIGNFIVIIDNIEGYTGDNTIEIQKVQALDSDGNLLAIHTPKTFLSSLTDTEETEEENEIDITVYPNPASDVIAIDYSLKNVIQRIDIRSISGRWIKSVNPSDMGNIDISALTNGVYILELQTGSTTVYRKLVKQ